MKGALYVTLELLWNSPLVSQAKTKWGEFLKEFIKSHLKFIPLNSGPSLIKDWYGQADFESSPLFLYYIINKVNTP